MLFLGIHGEEGQERLLGYLDVPDRLHPGLVNLRHLVCALVMSLDGSDLLNSTKISREDALTLLAVWDQRDSCASSLDQLTERLRELRSNLLANIFGDAHETAIYIYQNCTGGSKLVPV